MLAFRRNCREIFVQRMSISTIGRVYSVSTARGVVPTSSPSLNRLGSLWVARWRNLYARRFALGVIISNSSFLTRPWAWTSLMKIAEVENFLALSDTVVPETISLKPRPHRPRWAAPNQTKRRGAARHGMFWRQTAPYSATSSANEADCSFSAFCLDRVSCLLNLSGTYWF